MVFSYLFAIIPLLFVASFLNDIYLKTFLRVNGNYLTIKFFGIFG